MAASAAAPAAATAVSSGSGSSILGSAAQASSLAATSSVSAAQFREIHKNTWLKRLTAEGKKITVGPKKSDRSWVVFCVHDDTEALLEGYAEPRQAASHTPEWIVTMQDTLHISHALIPNSHEFEFVVTLSNEVVRFHAMSWDIMQEWVETLRSKLREMKILSPRENLYTKLPEIRAPLLPTRDPTSPLPAPPPVPAALVPGVERVVAATAPTVGATPPSDAAAVTSSATREINPTPTTTQIANNSSSGSGSGCTVPALICAPPPLPLLTSMSNMLTQNLLNMLSDPISAYSEQLNEEAAAAAAAAATEGSAVEAGANAEFFDSSNEMEAANFSDFNDEEDFHTPLLRKSSGMQSRSAAVTAVAFDNSVRVDIGASGSSNTGASHRVSADQIKNLENLLQCERLIPRPQTSRSLSAGAADKSRKHIGKFIPTQQQHNESFSTAALSSNANKCNNITEFEINTESETNHATTTTTITTTATAVVTTSSKAATAAANTTTATDPKNNITIIQVSSTNSQKNNNTENEADTVHSTPPKLPAKNTTADIFKFPESSASLGTPKSMKHHEYKSNVQIIPSNVNSSTIQVLGQNTTIAVANQYSTPIKKPPSAEAATVDASASSSSSASTSSVVVTANVAAQCYVENQSKVTTVHVAGASHAAVAVASAISSAAATTTTASVSVYGTCYSTPSPKLPKKIILSANTSGITNISVNNANTTSSSSSHIESSSSSTSLIRSNGAADSAASAAGGGVKHNIGNVHYEKVFLSSSIPISSRPAVATVSTSTETSTAAAQPPPMSPKWKNSPRRQATTVSSCSTQTTDVDNRKAPSSASSSTQIQTPSNTAASAGNRKNFGSPSASTAHIVSGGVGGSPALQRRRIASPTSIVNSSSSSQPPLPTRPAFLTRRGLTEAVITSRPSRKDFHYLKQTKFTNSGGGSGNNKNTPAAAPISSSNNNGESSSAHGTPLPPTPLQHAAVNRTNSESLEQRRRSSSTSDAAAQRSTRGANNNEFPGAGGRGAGGNALLRIQQPPQPFRSVENGIGDGQPVNTITTKTTTTSPPAAKRMTLREQQVMQLRREIMHPGGVRLQLRRKDCVGSIAWVDAFGAVWVAGWKQKEHPVLYNALHIGDQLLSIAGMTISTATEANKVIRNANTLFVEVLVRRIPFGRGYAIRREREGQCLGLIRDGNSSTIVDVVPNSLAARHGLPPKAQSCDGTTLTFWVLTEINGRPLNLFFKENEIRDRLNSVGRDISIFVQPSDLIAKLKKQLKSLRGYKDYLVQ